ncbi:MAG: type II toxin-antitoxin system HicA family toxin [Verrucomicrobiaceae bacterium]|nr:type II toxin-antitoxin system HicA family toxin [Verrucomicrobiaceae bacterium]
MKRLDLLKHLEAHGCHFIREGGNHTWYGNPTTKRKSTLPRHREIDPYLARKICRDLGIPEPTKK